MDTSRENLTLSFQRLQHLRFGLKESRKIKVYDKEGGERINKDVEDISSLLDVNEQM